MLGSAAWLVSTSTILGGLAGFAAVLGGVGLGFRYRKKATVNVEAKAHRVCDGVLVSTRHSVSSIGPFRLKFAKTNGATVTLIQVLATSDGTTRDGEPTDERAAFPQDVADRDQFVHQGETLSSGVVFRFVEPNELPQDLLGWTVVFDVSARGLRRGLHWEDRMFLPLPANLALSKLEEPDGQQPQSGKGRSAQ
jgi:hypothetical protein